MLRLNPMAMTSVALLSLALCASSIRAADDAPVAALGEIVGTVVDPSGKPAKDCIVTAQQDAEKMRSSLSASTDAEGRFRIEYVPEGDYNIKINTRDAKARATQSITVISGKVANAGTIKLKAK